MPGIFNGPLRGVALLVTAGILTLLSLAAVALVGLAGQARIQSDAGTDRTGARLLARSGVEYAAARIAQDSSPRTPATPENQPDDWIYRDERDVPLEKSLNPSYAQTEPYREAGLPNGRFDGAVEPYTDLDGNGRFDSWSGRLRGRYGMESGTFRLKVGGTGGSTGGSGGVNVNSGILEPLAYDGDSPDWDINKNGIPDYQDLEKFWGGPLERCYSPVNPFARNVRIAYALNQLGLLLGIAPSPSQMAGAAASVLSPPLPPPGSVLGWAPQYAAQLQNSPPPSPQIGIGDAIVAHRPLGGYRELDELEKLFTPADWKRLRNHLSVRSRRNPSAGYRSHGMKAYQFGGYLPGWGEWVSYGFNEPDVSYFVDPGQASREVLASAFAGMGENYLGTFYTYFRDRSEISPIEALRVADFLKRHPFVSGYELFGALEREKGVLFFPVSADPSSMSHLFTSGDLAYPGFTQALKASWVHALATPDEPGQVVMPCIYDHVLMDFSCWSFATYDRPRHPAFVSTSGYEAEEGHFYVRAPKSGAMWGGRLLVENRDRTVSGPAFALGSGASPFFFAVESLGRVAGAKGEIHALRNASASILNESAVAARTQHDFENFDFDRRTRRSSAESRFGGGVAEGRPRRDRVATYPFFSFDACPGLKDHPYLDREKGCYPIFEYSDALLRDHRFVCDFNYYRYGGEVMLSPHSWVDSEAVFYRPCWDLDQPERPPCIASELGWGQTNFDDAARGAKWQRPPFDPGDWTTLIFGLGLLAVDCNFPALRATPTLSSWATSWDRPIFLWDPDGRPKKTEGWDNSDKTADNRGNFPLLSDAGTVEQGTFEGWYVNAGVLFTGYPNYWSNSIAQVHPMRVLCSDVSWGQDEQGGFWEDPAPPPSGEMRIRHVAFAFSAAEGRVSAYVDGIPHGGVHYEAKALDTAYSQDLWCAGSRSFPHELRIYPKVLSQTEAQAHALRGWFWTAEAGAPVPSFTSTLYRFEHPVRLTQIGWDGFVPDVLRDAANRMGTDDPEESQVPLRVELLVYVGADPRPVEVELPRDSWKTGGCRADFKDLWQKAHPGEPPPRISALKYRVFLDASALDRAWKSPVFDGIEIGFKGAGGYSGLREQ